MDPNRSTSHSLHEKKRAPPSPVHINNVQLPQEDVKYLGYTLTGDLPGTNIFSQIKQLGTTLIKNVLVTLTKVKTLHKQQTSHI
jgi:hypothetical protein